MILQELYRYYERKKEEGEIAPPGYEYKEIPYIIVIDKDGSFVRFESTIYEENKKKRARILLVPKSVVRSSGDKAQFIWDHAGYVLGCDHNEPKKEKTPLEKLNRRQELFLSEIENKLNHIKDSDLEAIVNFLKKHKNEVKNDPLWPDISQSKIQQLLTFKIHGKKKIIAENDCIYDWISNHMADAESEESYNQGQLNTEMNCLITGKNTQTARIHPKILGVSGTNQNRGSIVSFNPDKPAFSSFGKVQNANAPVGNYAAFAYTTSLNTMLAKDSQQKLTIGDTSVVFWSEKKAEIENTFASFFSFEEKSLKDETEPLAIVSIRRLLESPYQGKQGNPEKDTNFYVLGLSPNASRIAIRFWYQATVTEIEDNLRQYFLDLQMVHPDSESDVLPLWLLLKSTAVQGKNENIHPLMASGLFEAILANRVFPRIVLNAIIGRIHAEPEASRKFEYCRASLLKAYINCLVRAQKYDTKILEEKMDEKNTGTAYRLGRLFAVLENLQGKAIGNPNASIRDRYYASASSRPATVFPVLLNMTNHHISKLKEGGGIWGDKLIQEILSVFPAESPFPKVMAVEEQGLFAVGYYQQKQWLYTKKEER